jgi:hypothetical protein
MVQRESVVHLLESRMHRKDACGGKEEAFFIINLFGNWSTQLYINRVQSPTDSMPEPRSREDDVHVHVQRAMQSLMLEDRMGAVNYLRRALVCLTADVNKKTTQCSKGSFRAEWN